MACISHVAAITEKDSRIVRRVVVTEHIESFRFHVEPHERLIVVPGLLVPEPVPWDMIPWMMQTVKEYVRGRNEP